MAALRASPIRKQVRRTVREFRPWIGERSSIGAGKGGRIKGRGWPETSKEIWWGMSACSDVLGGVTWTQRMKGCGSLETDSGDLFTCGDDGKGSVVPRGEV